MGFQLSSCTIAPWRNLPVIIGVFAKRYGGPIVAEGGDTKDFWKHSTFGLLFAEDSSEFSSHEILFGTVGFWSRKKPQGKPSWYSPLA